MLEIQKLPLVTDKYLLSVVIVNYNRRDDLREALESVRRQDYPDTEIIVVDNASSDGSIEMLRREFPEVRVIALKENIGMDGYSEGFRHAKGEFIFQMDNDSLMPDPTVLSEVVKRFMTGSEDLAVVATRVEEYNGAGDIEKLRSSDSRTGPINTGGFHSGGVGFRRSFLDRVGYYNRDIFLYGAELFLQMKFLAAGYRIFFYPEIFMLHKSSGVARSSRGLYYELRNRYWFMRCFATRAQRMRFLPFMLFHDFVYSLYKRGLRIFLRSLREGFGAIPASLAGSQRSDNPDFTAKVNEVCRQFGIRKFSTRVHDVLK